MASSNTAFPNDLDDTRQPEIAILRPKIEILVSPKV